MVREAIRTERVAGAVQAVHVALGLVGVAVDFAVREEARLQKRRQPLRQSKHWTHLLPKSTRIIKEEKNERVETHQGGRRLERLKKKQSRPKIAP